VERAWPGPQDNKSCLLRLKAKHDRHLRAEGERLRCHQPAPPAAASIWRPAGPLGNRPRSCAHPGGTPGRPGRLGGPVPAGPGQLGPGARSSRSPPGHPAPAPALSRDREREVRGPGLHGSFASPAPPLPTSCGRNCHVLTRTAWRPGPACSGPSPGAAQPSAPAGWAPESARPRAPPPAVAGQRAVVPPGALSVTCS